MLMDDEAALEEELREEEEEELTGTQAIIYRNNLDHGTRP